jgi:hypothetical protein
MKTGIAARCQAIDIGKNRRFTIVQQFLIPRVKLRRGILFTELSDL